MEFLGFNQSCILGGSNVQEELERNASRKAARNSQSSSTNTNSSATSVLNCTKCGSISLVPSNSTQCPSCGFKVSEEHGRGQESGAGSFGSSPQFSSHFWSNSPAPQGSGPRMQEVACPTCTVHLQVLISFLYCKAYDYFCVLKKSSTLWQVSDQRLCASHKNLEWLEM